MVKLEILGRDTSDPRVDDLFKVQISIIGWYSFAERLSLRLGEYQTLGAALTIGAKKTQGHLSIEVDVP
jgi:hypothetical protein